MTTHSNAAAAVDNWLNEIAGEPTSTSASSEAGGGAFAETPSRNTTGTTNGGTTSSNRNETNEDTGARKALRGKAAALNALRNLIAFEEARKSRITPETIAILNRIKEDLNPEEQKTLEFLNQQYSSQDSLGNALTQGSILFSTALATTLAGSRIMGFGSPLNTNIGKTHMAAIGVLSLPGVISLSREGFDAIKNSPKTLTSTVSQVWEHLKTHGKAYGFCIAALAVLGGAIYIGSLSASKIPTIAESPQNTSDPANPEVVQQVEAPQAQNTSAPATQEASPQIEALPVRSDNSRIPDLVRENIHDHLGQDQREHQLTQRIENAVATPSNTKPSLDGEFLPPRSMLRVIRVLFDTSNFLRTNVSRMIGTYLETLEESLNRE